MFIAEYFLTEQDDWKNAIDFRVNEIEEGETWLTEVLRYDTIPNLARKVEHYLAQYAVCKQSFYYLKSAIVALEGKLQYNNLPLSNEEMKPPLQQEQNALRTRIHNLEKD